MYRLEPIVPLRDSEMPVYAELLYGPYSGGHKPKHLALWREWYGRLADRVPQKLADGKFQGISVNVDTEHLLDEQILESLMKLSGLPVGIEWTEGHDASLSWVEVELAGANLVRLADDCNFPIILDDVGAGEDMLFRLARVAHSSGKLFAKIDGGIFQQSLVSSRLHAMLRGMIRLFHAQGMLVCIEWIENEYHLERAKSLGADYGQGFLWAEAETEPVALSGGQATPYLFSR